MVDQKPQHQGRVRQIMSVSRRNFIKVGAGAAAAAACLVTSDAQAAGAKKIGACGIACCTCPMMKAGKCGGCAAGKDATDAMVAKKGCKVLACAHKKGISYCGTDCPGFTKCGKLIGKPYSQDFMDMLKKKMG